MESNLVEYIENMADCADSMCVNCQTSSASAMKKMKELAEMPVEIVNSQHYFPLDDRVLLDISWDHPKYSHISRAVVHTFQQSYSLFARPPVPDTDINAYLKPIGVLEIDSILLATRDGIIYLVDKSTKLHRCLRSYCEWIKLTCTFQASNEPRRTPSCHTVLSLPEFQHDNTHLRRSRFVEKVGNDDFFLELDTGLIRKMPQEESRTDATHFSPLFKADPSYQKFHLANRKNMTPLEILNTVIRMAKTKKVRVVGYESDHQLRSVAVIKEHVENPLEGFWPSDDSDDE